MSAIAANRRRARLWVIKDSVYIYGKTVSNERASVNTKRNPVIFFDNFSHLGLLSLYRANGFWLGFVVTAGLVIEGKSYKLCEDWLCQGGRI